MRKRVLLIGPKNSGKTTLANYVEGNEEKVKKKAHIVYKKDTIDTPSTYLESPWMRQHLISLQQSAYLGLFLLPLSAKKGSYPPGFSHVFRIPLIGVITYTSRDVLTPEAKVRAEKQLKEIGQFETIIFLNIEAIKGIDTVIKFYQERR
ncbi:hypothetical protein OL233_07695 [Vagococcus sp. PNs007]|uniref:Ethanolamine utilization protein EutP n=1 Tax=Vagococcus proximus TaxID=2991417 RepID=A0ABT5X2G0_9ENTE|nr:EutP/PduV family microcompartment system protein [Vagococcus proximus]MDF0480175.1 hypothetical protein [Vagococcus proximus]